MEKLLKDKGVSIYELANAIDESQQRMHYIVKKKNFTEDYLILKRVAQYLNCEIEDLLDL
jgi:DNA-binding Xre family transcriptional regulator